MSFPSACCVDGEGKHIELGPLPFFPLFSCFLCVIAVVSLSSELTYYFLCVDCVNCCAHASDREGLTNSFLSVVVGFSFFPPDLISSSPLLLLAETQSVVAMRREEEMRKISSSSSFAFDSWSLFIFTARKRCEMNFHP